MAPSKYWRFMNDLETSSLFKIPVSILYYGTTIGMVLLFFLSKQWFILFGYYLAFWGVFFVLYWLLFQKEGIGHLARDFINVIDDPIDELKEYLHCMPLPFGYQLNISCIMQNRKTTWDIIRKRGVYENCDPSDPTK